MTGVQTCALPIFSESAIDNPEVIKELKAVGYHGFLIGENFMKTDDPGQAIRDFVGKL